MDVILIGFKEFDVKIRSVGDVEQYRFHRFFQGPMEEFFAVFADQNKVTFQIML